MKQTFRFVVLTLLAATSLFAQELPQGYMSEAETRAILDKTQRVHLAPDLSHLSETEVAVVRRLMEVGEILQRVHDDMRHPHALQAYASLAELDARLGSPPATQNLLTLYYAARGPVLRDLEGKRRPFLPADPPAPGRNVYPWNVAREEMEAFFTAHPDARPALLALRAVVRRTERASLDADLAALHGHPAIDALHPGLRASLEALRADPEDRAYYAVPYSVAYAEETWRCYEILSEAAAAIRADDPDFAAYLGARARDFLSDDYEAGDAAWVSGRFRNLNAEIGAYETYNDGLYGAKAFPALSVLARDAEQSGKLREAIRGLQEFQNALPYAPDGWKKGTNKKAVREDIPVGVYDVVADFGQARGANTATILPNESAHARKYGRTILLRRNIMMNPDIFAVREAAFAAAVAPAHAGELTAEGGFQRTLWHEIGHYLGPDRARDGRAVDDALGRWADTMEELKADLVSLHLTRALEARGYHTPASRRAVLADGVRRVLRKRKPERTQAYATMELMQLNFYLERGALAFDAASGRLEIRYDRFHDAVVAMLERVLALQYGGDPAAAEAFVDALAVWREDLHGVLAERMRAAEPARFTYVTYEALTNPRALAR
jgi:hypothetical protein